MQKNKVSKVRVINRGIGLGVFASGLNLWLLLGFEIVFVVWSGLSWQRLTRLERVGSFLIVVGGLMNWLKRIFWRGVWDYLSFGGLWFNVADVMIFVGLVMFLWSWRKDYGKD